MHLAVIRPPKTSSHIGLRYNAGLHYRNCTKGQLDRRRMSLLNGDVRRRSTRCRDALRPLRIAHFSPEQWRAKMSNLVVLGFDGIHTADEVQNKLRSLQREYLIDLEDSCVVERDKAGKVYIKQAVNMTALGAASGGSRGAM